MTREILFRGKRTDNGEWVEGGLVEQANPKEVAEITYDNGTRKYADIGCDSNLTAVYDVIAVIQQIKPRSSAIERIERGVYRQYPIESIPAADVQPLVQCFCIKLSGGLMRRYTAPDDYCCWGERKEDADMTRKERVEQVERVKNGEEEVPE